MPSNARKLFRDKLLPDVAALIETHRTVNPNGQGRRALGHITRSGVVMLCAAWELYIEEVLVESVKFLVAHEDLPNRLADNVKGRIAQAAKSDPHAHGALRLCGDGWKAVYVEAVKKDCAGLNTPKFGQVSELLEKWLGLPPADLEGGWRTDRATLNDLVTLRGDIAHRGADAAYVRISRLGELKAESDDRVVDTDRVLSDYLFRLAGRRPWRR